MEKDNDEDEDSDDDDYDHHHHHHNHHELFHGGPFFEGRCEICGRPGHLKGVISY